jgi:peptide/nickel transport system substrate-binding protein
MLEGTGPFRVTEWSESEIILERFQAYPGEKWPFQRVRFRHYGSGEEVLSAFRRREIGAFILKPGEGMPPEEAVRLLSPELYFLAFNLKDPFLKDAQVRKALTMAVNREELLREVLNGEGILAKGPFLPGHLEEEPDLPAFNPAEARKILEERGWLKEGVAPKLGIMVNGENKVREAIALMVAKYYRAIGIDAEVWVMEWGNFLEALFGGYFQVAVFSIPLGPDLDLSPFFSAAGEFNFSSVREPQVDELLERGLKVTGCNPKARRKIYSSLAFTLTELRPWDFLFFPYYFMGPEELSFLKQS